MRMAGLMSEGITKEQIKIMGREVSAKLLTSLQQRLFKTAGG